MEQLKAVEVKGIRVLTTPQLAECYGTTRKIISYNFQYNKSRYVEGKHYIELKGEELKEFKSRLEIQDSLKYANTLCLWTEKGALLHAKSLNTDKAWEVYDYLVDFYFRVKEEKEETKPVPVEPKKKEEEIPHMDNPIRILKVLLKVAEDKGIDVDSYPFKAYNSVLKGSRIGIRTEMSIERTVYELAWELSHVFIHYDNGDMIHSPLSKDYNQQATRAAGMIIKMLNAKMKQM